MRQARKYHVWDPEYNDVGGGVSSKSDLPVDREKNCGGFHREDTVKHGQKKSNTFSLRSSILPEV